MASFCLTHPRSSESLTIPAMRSPTELTTAIAAFDGQFVGSLKAFQRSRDGSSLRSSCSPPRTRTTGRS